MQTTANETRGDVWTAAAVVWMAAAVVLTAVAEDQGQPHVGLLVGSGGDDGSLWTHSFFWQHLAIIWHPF